MKTTLSEKLKKIWLYLTFNLSYTFIKFKAYRWLYFIYVLFNINKRQDHWFMFKMFKHMNRILYHSHVLEGKEQSLYYKYFNIFKYKHKIKDFNYKEYKIYVELKKDLIRDNFNIIGRSFRLTDNREPSVNVQNLESDVYNNLEITDPNKTLNELVNKPSAILDRKNDD